MERPHYTLHPLGDKALLVHFGNCIDASLNDFVLAFFETLKQKNHAAITDLVPAYASLAVHYNPLLLQSGHKTAFQTMSDLLKQSIETTLGGEPPPARIIEIPVCYAAPFAPDLKTIAAEKNLSEAAVIEKHYKKIYRVYMIGFLPGFAYLGQVDESIAMKRKDSPSPNIAAGSVGIAGRQTGIYPLKSPGGWQIIGRTPLKIFDQNRNPPVLLQPGDQVQFIPISQHEFENYQSRLA